MRRSPQSVYVMWRTQLTDCTPVTMYANSLASYMLCLYVFGLPFVDSLHANVAPYIYRAHVEFNIQMCPRA